MEHDDQKDKLTFTTKGAWLGLAAYIVVVLLLVTIFIVG
jgi:hypothetical protein